MTKEIKLTQGQVAIVDDWWFEELNQYKWYAYWNPHTNSYYSRRNNKLQTGKVVTVLMHSVVSGAKSGSTTDHINHDTLDNREENLRVCSKSDNAKNARLRSDSSSGYKGVTWNKKKLLWNMQIQSNKQRIVKYYNTAKEAAKAYDEHAIVLHGDFAYLNFPDNIRMNRGLDVLKQLVEENK